MSQRSRWTCSCEPFYSAYASGQRQVFDRSFQGSEACRIVSAWLKKYVPMLRQTAGQLETRVALDNLFGLHMARCWCRVTITTVERRPLCMNFCLMKCKFSWKHHRVIANKQPNRAKHPGLLFRNCCLPWWCHAFYSTTGSTRHPFFRSGFNGVYERRGRELQNWMQTALGYQLKGRWSSELGSVENSH